MVPIRPVKGQRQAVSQAAGGSLEYVSQIGPEAGLEVGLAHLHGYVIRLTAFAALLCCGAVAAQTTSNVKPLLEPAPSSAPASSPAASPAPDGGGALDALKQLRDGLLGDGEPEFLDPAQAFVLDARINDAGLLDLNWDIADGYYLYRKRFDVKLSPVDGLERGPLAISDGEIKEDPYFGTVEVYYGSAGITAPLLRSGSATEARTVDVDVRYQGCADAGLCYPPITRTVSLELPPAGAVATSAGAVAAPPGAGSVAASAGSAGSFAAATSQPLPAQDRIAAALAGGSAFWVLLSFFGFGLLLTFTPCVLPMIPILSGIIAGQGMDVGAGRAFRLSLVYVLAMAAAYTAVGVAAGNERRVLY